MNVLAPTSQYKIYSIYLFVCNAYCSTLITFVGIQAIGLENQKKDPFVRLHLAFSFSVSLTIPLFAAVTVIHKYMHKKYFNRWVDLTVASLCMLKVSRCCCTDIVG